MSVTGLPTHRTAEEAVEIAAALGPRLKARVSEAEANRRLPEDTVADLRASGLIALETPRKFGGTELSLDALLMVSSKLAESCASTGWVYSLWASHMWLIGQFPEHTQAEVFADPSARVSSVVNTVGAPVRVEDGVRWTGRGFFSSGVDYSTWLTAAVEVETHIGGPKERHWVLMTRDQYEIVDDWDTVGLQGTGSKTIIINDAFIPNERIVHSPTLSRGEGVGATLHASPLYCAAMDFTFSLPLPGAALGIGAAAVQAFAAKSAERLSGTNPKLAVEQTANVMRIASAGAQVEAARALLLSDARRFCNLPAADATVMERAQCRRDVAWAVQQCRAAVNSLFEGAGGSGVYMRSEFQRLWRDANVATAHHGLMWDIHGLSWGRLAVGLEAMPNVRGL